MGRRRILRAGEVDVDGEYVALREEIAMLDRVIEAIGHGSDTAAGWAKTILTYWRGDFEIRRKNDHFRVTLFEPSYEHIAWGESQTLAILGAARKAVQSYAERTGFTAR